MKPNSFIPYLRHLERINPKAQLQNGVVVFCANWSLHPELQDVTLDFYAIKEVNPVEGRLTGTAVGHYSRDHWLIRSGGEVDFWVVEFDRGIYHASYCHPESNHGMAVTLGYGFNCPEGMAIATAENKDRDRHKRLSRDRFKTTKEKNDQQLTLNLP